MAFCERCARYWLVKTGAIVTRAVMARSSVGVIDIPDLVCPRCQTPADTKDDGL